MTPSNYFKRQFNIFDNVKISADNAKEILVANRDEIIRICRNNFKSYLENELSESLILRFTREAMQSMLNAAQTAAGTRKLSVLVCSAVWDAAVHQSNYCRKAEQIAMQNGRYYDFESEAAFFKSL